MGAETPAAGGETKPVVKHEGRPPYHGGLNNANKNTNHNYNTREKFLAADAHLFGKVFKDKRTRSEQVANFETLDDLLKAQMGTEYDPFSLVSLEQGSKVGPSESIPVYKAKAEEPIQMRCPKSKR